MRIQWAVILCVACMALLMTGCDCEAESDEELCGGRECGVATLVDNCGDERTVDCGECVLGEECDDHQCVCEGETDDVLCARIGAECGVHGVTDECGHSRQVECGDCAEPDQCVAGSCACLSEPEDQLCDIHALECGAATVENRCGDDRHIDCGFCIDPDHCEDNQCICEGEPDGQLCDGQGLECGSADIEDRCGAVRSADCGGCPDHYDCTNNACECTGESDEALCDAIAGACGTVETTDTCGVERSVECQPCAGGESTFGAVRDADTGELLDDATIKVYEWPPPGGEHFTWFWSPGFRAGDPDYATTTAATDGDINYEFASQQSMCADDQIATLEAHEWYRYVVERPGYEPGVFYRVHPGYSSADCAADCAAADDAACHRQNFELWAEGTAYPQKPNLFVDPRELEDNLWQCTLMPDDSPVDELIGFRARLGAANVGHGPFHLEGLPDDGGTVVQHIEWSDGSVDTRTVPSGTFEYHGPHHHIHFMDWFAMRFVTPSEDCRDIDDRSGGCIAHGGIKISYCLHDLDPFDGDVMNFYGGQSAMFLDPPVCDTSEQGVTQGWRDTYARGLPGQVIIVGTPAEAADLGEVWLEAEVDPKRMLEESERHGNVARKRVEPPSNICGNPDKVLDCSIPEDQYGTAQRRQCGDYLDYVD